jgi:hypothetical protein
MGAAADVASAILGVVPNAPRFPAIGVIARLTVYRGAGGDGPITRIGNLAVRIDDVLYRCGWSGAFVAEIEFAGLYIDGGADEAAGFVGRRVKVENLGGQLVIAYTVNS